MKIIIGAIISRYPFVPGSVWNRIHCLLGLQALGHDVVFIEEIAPEECVDAKGEQANFGQSINRELFGATMKRFGLTGQACQIYNHGESTCGLSFESLVTLARQSDLLINISGHISTESILGNVKRRVYVDDDPVFTQLWSAEYGADLNFEKHDVFFSRGLNIGTPYSSIPDGGPHWHHVLPPVVREYWPFQIDPSGRRFTTIASWSGYKDLSYHGEWYRSKHEEFKQFAALPTRTDQEIEVSLKSYREGDAGIRLLRDNGWFLRKAGQIADLSCYQDYIARSRAEIGIAKNAYVKARSGWFSDRAAHYLASGKPVLHQSTGFERCLPTGRGLLTFTNMEEAVEGIETINRNYDAHCRAAREFAEEYLDYGKVLPGMLEVCVG